MRVSRATEAIVPYSPGSEAPPASREDPLEEGRTQAHFGQLLVGLGRELDRGERLAHGAIHGASSHAHMSPQQLIALQAGIYRYSEAVDLVTKLVDRASQAVKTTLQNQ